MASGKMIKSWSVISILLIITLLSSGCTGGPEEHIGDILSPLDTLGGGGEFNASDISSCKKKFDPDSCYLRFAKDKDDITICEKIEDPSTRTHCLKFIRFNYELRGHLSNCGGDGKPCCGEDFCDYGYECQDDGKCHVTCGQHGFPCCENNYCDKTKRLVCNSNNICQNCGGEHQLCCLGDFCHPGYECAYNGICMIKE